MNKLFVLMLLLSSFLAHGQAGVVPPLMPQKLSVGLFEDTGRTWMKNSGVPWQIRYRYFTYKWSSNWGFGPKDGAFAGQFFRESDTQGYLPAVAYYEIYDIPPAGAGQLAKMQNPAAMAEYFGDFKILMQQAKTFGKPVLVMVEADATGFLQGEVNSNPDAMSAVASTGLPELAGLPNTAAGWGLAFLQLRKSVGANNVILGMHVSGWASGQDLFHSSPTVALQPAVDKVANFLAPLGLAANVTGQTYDVLVADPLDRDADYYRIARGEDRWWDTSNTAALNTKSFTRYAEWLRLWNIKTSKRWVLWQIPVGNSASLNVCNAGLLNQGYKDNRSAYFFGTGSAVHRQLFVNNGVVSMLFGAGEGCQSSFEVDGNVLKTTVGAFFAAGGLALPGAAPVDAGVPVDAGTPVVDAGVLDAGQPDAGCVCVCPTPDAGPVDSGTPVADSGVVDAGTPVVDAGTPPIDAGAPVVDAGQPSADPSQYNFETGTQGFTASVGTVSRSTGPVFAGVGALGVALANQLGTSVQVANPVVPRGATITYRLFVPAGAPLTSIQVFAQETSATSWKWNAKWLPASGLVPGWNSIALALPTVPGVLQSLGVEFQFTAGFTGSVYIDSISWNGTVPAVDAGTPIIDAGTPVADAGTPVVDSGQPIIDAGAGLRLMPLGDSITAEDHAWRCELKRRLGNITLVGSQTSQYDECPYHEGHPGFTSANINSAVQGYLNASAPDVVVVMVGTNDIAWWTAESGTQVADRIDGMTTRILSTRPGVRVVVCTIPPQSSSIIAPNNVDRATLTNQLNARLRTLTNARAAAGQRVRLAEVNGALQLSDLRDGIHPTPTAGINKIAPVIAGAVQQVLLVP